MTPIFPFWRSGRPLYCRSILPIFTPKGPRFTRMNGKRISSPRTRRSRRKPRRSRLCFRTKRSREMCRYSTESPRNYRTRSRAERWCVIFACSRPNCGQSAVSSARRYTAYCSDHRSQWFLPQKKWKPRSNPRGYLSRGTQDCPLQGRFNRQCRCSARHRR